MKNLKTRTIFYKAIQNKDFELAKQINNNEKYIPNEVLDKISNDENKIIYLYLGTNKYETAQSICEKQNLNFDEIKNQYEKATSLYQTLKDKGDLISAIRLNYDFILGNNIISDFKNNKKIKKEKAVQLYNNYIYFKNYSAASDINEIYNLNFNVKKDSKTRKLLGKSAFSKGLENKISENFIR